MRYRKLKHVLIRLFSLVGILYIALCSLLYFYQTKLLFHPTKTPSNTSYYYHNNYKEIIISIDGDVKIHNVLFKTNINSKGVILFLHGNAGSVFSWGKLARIYNQLGYDVWMPDYRGFGKSEGEIIDEEQLYNDIVQIFSKVKSMYEQEKINIIGYSMGSGLATRLAAQNRVKKLILLAPYYGMDLLVSEKLPGIPSFLLKFPIKTYNYIQQINCPIYIFHGREDNLIPFEHGLKLKKLLKKNDMFFALSKQGHGRIHSNPDFIKFLKQIL